MTIPGEPPFEYAPLFRLERARLLELLASLSPADLLRPTPCPAWDVLGVVNHLVGADLSLISRQRDHHHGTPAPGGLDEAAFAAWLDELQIEWVRAARRVSPRLAGELLAWTSGQVADTIAGQDPRSRAARVSWASDDQVPVWLDQARELTERWIHRQQLHEAIGQPSDLRADLAGPVLDALRWAYPHQLNSAPGASETRVGVQITDPPLAGTWRLAFDGHEWSFTDRGDGNPPTLVSMTAEQAWRLLSNNYRADSHGAIRTAGDPATIALIMRTRAVLGA